MRAFPLAAANVVSATAISITKHYRCWPAIDCIELCWLDYQTVCCVIEDGDSWHERSTRLKKQDSSIDHGPQNSHMKSCDFSFARVHFGVKTGWERWCGICSLDPWNSWLFKRRNYRPLGNSFKITKPSREKGSVRTARTKISKISGLLGQNAESFGLVVEQQYDSMNLNGPSPGRVTARAWTRSQRR